MNYFKTVIYGLLLTWVSGQVMAVETDFEVILDELKVSLIAEPSKSSELIQYLKENVRSLTQEQQARFLTLESNKELYNGMYDKAYRLLVSAEKLSHSASLLNSIHLYQATSLIALRNYQGALEAMSKNLSRIEEIDDVTIKMTSYLRLANLYLDLEVFEEVQRYASLALELSKGISSKEQCYAKLLLSASALKLAHYQESEQAFAKTKSYCSEHHIPLIVAMSDKGLGDSALKLGKFDTAKKHLLSALNQYQKFQFQLELNDVNSLLAETYLSLSDLDNAINYAQMVMSLPDEISHFEAKKRATKVMAVALEKRGDFEQAYNYLGDYLKLSDSLIDETKAKAYAYQMAKFENAEKTREIKMLNQDRALYTSQQKVVELERYNESLALMILLGCSVGFVIFGMTMFIQQRKYKRISQLDQLTGIFNRGTGQDFAENLFIDVLAHRGVFSVIMFDLDYFKTINDTLGHSAGDWALKRVVEAVNPLLKSRDLFVRMGGEEFAIFLPYMSAEEALHLAEKCRVAIDNISTRPHYSKLSITASFGVCTSLENDLSLDPMMKRADAAMYQAKHSGRDCVVEYQADMVISEAS
ncbi:GGDEF domain-containing protein [Shewanella mesophila]|uniref:GGDEF domain-containing protein n=1 Tax=Shewanella mesophila TaxID=2864208 RepID=UPI001C65B3FF|nr:GGDEF domain-containing protein [Shewanella mesophila]QYJ85119.1 GGDEF domain-containing protein [Shewanella mesophila]